MPGNHRGVAEEQAVRSRGIRRSDAPREGDRHPFGEAYRRHRMGQRVTCPNGIFSFGRQTGKRGRPNDGKRPWSKPIRAWAPVWGFFIRAFSGQAGRAAQPEGPRIHSPRMALFLAGPFLPSAGPSFPRDDAMTRDTLSTLDLSERPGQRVIWIRRVPHYQVDGPVELRPGERTFAAGPYHSAYVVMVEREDRLEAATSAGGVGP
jgi:hypothetical protein